MNFVPREQAEPLGSRQKFALIRCGDGGDALYGFGLKLGVEPGLMVRMPIGDAKRGVSCRRALFLDCADVQRISDKVFCRGLAGESGESFRI